MKRLLITGAAGGLGTMARARLKHMAEIIRVADITDLGPAAENEEVVTCDLADRDAVFDMVEWCDAIIHFGGMSLENTFNVVLNANIIGLYNLYEAARAHGQPRILFASSNHVIGFHRQTEWLDAGATMRPDSLYGVSKCFGENLANMYHDKFGQETAIVRFGSCFPEPVNHRMLATWLSYDDCVRMIECIFRAPLIGCPIIYGVSDNDARWWDNSAAAFLGWKPKDNSEDYRAKVDASVAVPAPDAFDVLYQGGMFAAEGIHED